MFGKLTLCIFPLDYEALEDEDLLVHHLLNPSQGEAVGFFPLTSEFEGHLIALLPMATSHLFLLQILKIPIWGKST